MSNVPARVQDVHHRWLRLATTINIKNTGATGFDVSYACIQVFGGPVKPGDSTEQIVIWTASHYRTKPLAQKCEKLNDALTPDEHISRLFLIYLPKTYADKTLVVRTVTLTSAGAAKLWSCEEGQPLENCILSNGDISGVEGIWVTEEILQPAESLRQCGADPGKCFLCEGTSVSAGRKCAYVDELLEETCTKLAQETGGEHVFQNVSIYYLNIHRYHEPGDHVVSTPCPDSGSHWDRTPA